MKILRVVLALGLLLPSSLAPLAPAQSIPSLAAPATSSQEAPIFHETFNALWETLRGRGWTMETLDGPPPAFALVDGTATTATREGAYPAGLDARLVAPAFDLRRVPGAPLPVAPEIPANPLPELSDALANRTAPARENLTDPDAPAGLDARPDGAAARAGDDAALDGMDALRLWPPDENLTGERVRRERLPSLVEPSEVPRTEARAASPAAPEGAARIRLVLQHAWEFAPGDGAFVEARVREANGTWSAWRPLAAIVPENETASATGILPPSDAATATGTLPGGEPAFMGASDGPARSVFPLEAYAGRVVQVAFHVRSTAFLAPQVPGWTLHDVQVHALLGAPDLAVESFEGLDEVSAVALGAPLTPRVIVRNWGALPSLNATLRLAGTDAQDRPLPGLPALVPVPALAPGAIHAVPYPRALSSDAPTRVRLDALLVQEPTRPDASADNDRMALTLAFEDVDVAILALSQDPLRAVTAFGEERTFQATIQNVGNVARAGALELWATPLDPATGAPLGSAHRVAGADLVAPPSFSTVVRGLEGPDAPVAVDLAWNPAERGVYRVEARWGASTSAPVRAYVERTPPPLLDEPFGAEPSALRAFEPASASLLAGWTFDAWNLTADGPSRLPPEAPSPSRMLVARARDAPVGGDLAILSGAGEQAEGALVPVTLELPAALTADDASAPIDGAEVPVNVSYARVLFATEPARCTEVDGPAGRLVAPPACEDPSGRVALVNLSDVRATAVAEENLTLHKDRASIEVGNATIRSGGADARLLYVVVDGRLDPGLALAWAPLVLRRGNGEEATLLPAGTLRPYEEGGVRCCVLGPYGVDNLLDALGPLAAPDRVENGRAFSRYTVARDLADLFSQATPGAAERALAFEHDSLFAWNGTAGVRGLVEVETSGTLPPEARPSATPLLQPRERLSLESPTQGWETVILPLAGLPQDARLRLTLEATPDAASPPECPYLDQASRCDVEPTWRVDGVRLLERASSTFPWRVVVRDDLEDEDVTRRWSAGVSVHARGWNVEVTPTRVPHRWHLSSNAWSVDAEANATRALRWGEPASPRTATREPTWSLARTPFLDLQGLAAPRATFLTRYDFGDEKAGRFAAGGALAALVERRDGTRERVLLLPEEGGEEGTAYRGDVDAPAFEPLAGALQAQVPRGATASAFTGRSGVAPGAAGPAAWVPVRIDLTAFARDPDVRRVALEFHALAAAPLKGAGWLVDDLRVSEPGPALDVGLAGVPTVRAGAAAGLGTSVPLAVNVTRHGLFPTREVALELAVLDVAGAPVHPPPAANGSWAPARLVLDPEAIPADGAPLLVTFPKPWVPAAYGEHRIVARVLAPGDERPGNDLAVRPIVVRDASAASLARDGPLVRAPEGGAEPGVPIGLRVVLENRGTLPFNGTVPLALVVDVLGADGRSVLSAPLRVDPARHAGRPILPGEPFPLDLPQAWTPARSGIYRMVARLDAPLGVEVATREVSETFVVSEPLPPLAAEDFRAEGRGWTNATQGADPALWTFVAAPGAEGALQLSAPLALRTASRTLVELVHRHLLEEGFDGGRLEARVDAGAWEPVPPLDTYPGTLHEPTALALPGESDVAAFTGASAGTRTTLFDLAAAPGLRERVTLLSTDGTVGAANATESWLGPSLPPEGAAWHAPGRPAPQDAPAEAKFHERRDVLVQEFVAPSGATGDLVVHLREWRALGLSGSQDAPRSDALAYVEGPLDAATPAVRYLPAAPLAGPEDRHRDWTPLDLSFPGVLDALRGQRARLVVEHREIAAPMPDGTFASDALSPHGGLAVTAPALRARTPQGETPLAPAGPLLTGSASRWLARGDAPGEGTLVGLAEANATTDGFLPLAPASSRVWGGNATTGWTARADAQAFPDARLILPLDLSLAARDATLTLDDERRLSTRHDAEANATGEISLALVEISTDGGATWTPVPPLDPAVQGRAFTLDGGPLASRHGPGGADPEGNSPFGPEPPTLRSSDRNETRFDLTPFAGRPVLLALHAAFSTTSSARDDAWTVHALRVEADVLRGGDVDLRLRAAADANGAHGTWEVVSLSAKVVRHAAGLGVRLLGPGDGPLTQGFRTLDVEVVNRGADPTPARTLRIAIEDPPERGARLHETTRPIPPLEPGARALIPVRGADLNWYLGAGEGPSRVTLALDPLPDDALPGDDQLHALVGGPNVHERSRLVPFTFEITPQVVELDNATRGPVTFRLVARNDGEDAAGLAPSSLHVYRDGALLRTLGPARPATGRVEPGATVNLTWSWRPPESLPKGLYQVVAEVATTASRAPHVETVNGTLHVAGAFLKDLAYREAFGAVPGQGGTRVGWACATVDPCAREDAIHSRSAPVSLAVGLPSTRVPAETRALLQSPPFPVAGMARASLLLHARHNLSAGAEARIEAAAVREDGSLGPWRPVLDLTGRSARHDEGVFQPYAADLAPLLGERVAAVVLRIDAPRVASGMPAPLALDDVSVTPLDAVVEMPGEVTLADAVQKRVSFTVRNPGTLSDAYWFSFEDASGRKAALPPGWTASLVDALTGKVLAHTGPGAAVALDVPANGSREVHLLVSTPPTGAGLPLQGPVPLPLTLRSTLLPDLARHATMPLHARGAPRADLDVAGLSVRGADEPVGRTRAIEVALVNRGLAPAQARLDVRIDPPAGVAEAPQRIDGGLVTLGPGAARTLSLAWAPRHPGAHRVVATWDPDGAVLESNRANNRREANATVAPAPFPDLRVVFTLATDEPSLGAPLGYRLLVENRGTVAARQVEVTLRAGVAALLDPSPLVVGDLEPGARREVEGTWTPGVPGPLVVSATAFSRTGVPEGVETLADNGALARVEVRQESLRIDALPALPPQDGLLRAAFRLTSLGNANETYVLSALTPKGWSSATLVEGLPSGMVALAPGAIANVTLVLSPSPRAPAGPTPVTLVVESNGAGARREADASVDVPRQGSVRVVVLDAVTLPGDPALHVLVLNDANAPARLSLRADALPTGWTLRGTAGEVPAGSASRLRLALDLGNDTAPRAARAALSWRTEDAAGEAAGAFSLGAQRRVEVAMRAEAPAGGVGNLSVTLSNHGNVPEVAVLRVDLAPGLSTDLEGRTLRLAPGETRELVGILAAWDASADGSLVRVRLNGLPGAVAEAPLRLLHPNLRLGTEPPEGTFEAGQRIPLRVTVENVGNVPREGVVVELYVDGLAVATRTLGDLAPGAVAEADLSWHAEAGRHTLALVVAASQGAPDAEPADDARAWTLTIQEAPSFLPGAARQDVPAPWPLLTLLAMALARRRRP